MGIFKQSISFSLPKNLEKLGYLRGVLVGVIFAFVYTPCVGAVLGAILSLAAVSQTVYKGAVYHSFTPWELLPFIIMSLFFTQALPFLRKSQLLTAKLSLVAGLLLAFIGLMLVTDTYKIFNSKIFEIAFSLGYQIR